MERLWFSQKSPRKITLRAVALLVGKAPTKAKRLKMLCTMPLTGENVTGFPDWLADSRDFVMKSGETVNAGQTINYVNVTMGDENLFHKTPIEAPKSKLSHMVITNMGSSEDPLCVLKFQIMAPFSTDLHRWCDQMAGEEFETFYEVTESGDEGDAEEGDLELSGEEEEQEGEDADEDEDEEDLEGDEEEDELEAQQRRAAAHAARVGSTKDAVPVH